MLSDVNSQIVTEVEFTVVELTYTQEVMHVESALFIKFGETHDVHK